MHARVTHARILLDRVENSVKVMEESVIPALEQQAGFTGCFLLVDVETGNGLNITLWQSENDMTNSETNGFYQEQLAKITTMFAAPPSVATYRVAIHA